MDDMLNVFSSGASAKNPNHGSAANIAANPVLSNAILGFFDGQDANDEDDRPRAYLNWILFDEQFKFVESSSGFSQVGGPEELTVHQFEIFPVPYIHDHNYSG